MTDALAGLVTDEDLAWALDVYRHLHEHPELSGQEHETARFISAQLTAMGLDPQACGGTGVVAVLRNGSGPVVAFRADIDALPIEEQTGLEYASRVVARQEDGTDTPVMHACGHDLHTAVALAAARALGTRRDLWSGTAVWVFQPAEETARGAEAMVADGLWERAPRPDVVLAQHARAITEDQLLVGSGDVMNLGDSWRVTLRGRGSHASRPHESIDPIVLASHVVVRLQSVVSREVDPQRAAVVTVGTFHAGTKENVIPETATISLNMRSPDEQTRTQVLSAVRRVLEGECAISGAQPPQIEEISRFPRCYADPVESERVATALERAFGSGSVTRGFRTPGSEDVGRLADAVGAPLVFWFFGAYGRERAGQRLPQNHTPHFGPDAEPALRAGLRAAMTALGTYLAAGSTRG